MNLGAAIALSLLSAVAYALAAVTQERLAATSRTTSKVTPLLSSGRGWTAVSLNGGGALLHAAALAYASLTIVQPLGALTLVVALPTGAAIAHRRVRGREWRGAAATVAGLIGVLIAADTGAPSRALSDSQLLAVVAGTAVLIAILARAGRAATERLTGLRLAIAGGVAFAVASVVTQTVLLRLSDGGAAVLTDPVLVAAIVAVAAFSVAGLLLSQAAYRYGLGAQLATLTIVNPVVAAALGLALLGQGVGLGLTSIGFAGIAAVLAAVGVVQLATPEASPAGGHRHPSGQHVRRSSVRSNARRRRPAVRCAPMGAGAGKLTDPGAVEAAYREVMVGWSAVDLGPGSVHASPPVPVPRRVAAAPGEQTPAPAVGGG